jgi:maleylacetate reductase
VPPHVPSEEGDAAREFASAGRADAVVTFGGGSATGLGKAVALTNDVTLVAVPTTYAGSEVTPIHGTTAAGRKRTGRDERVLPRVVIYDPALTLSLAARVTASSGINAIAHCVEALYARDVDGATASAAEEAIGVLGPALRACVAALRDRTARTAALHGAYLAGTVLATAGMAIHHRICHVLGGTFGLSHGDANAVVLPHAVAFNAPAAPGAIETLRRALGSDNAASGLYDLAAALGAPTSLQELGMDRARLPEAAAIVMESDFYNPRPATVDDVAGVLEAAWEGRRPVGV